MTMAVMYIFPFIGDGPIFPDVISDFFLNSCSYWWTNFLLISNWVPWNNEEMCMSSVSLISNEFQMIIILIPLIGYIYKNYFRRALAVAFTTIGIFGSLVPVLYMTLVKGTDSSTGWMSNAYDNLTSKIWFRIPPFLIGMALAIFHFEYRYVDKLNDGSKPFHKDYLQKIVQNSWVFKTFCYTIGFLCLSVPLLLQVYNATCIKDDNVQDQMYYLDEDIQYCWKNVGGAIYYSISPIVFYSGVSLLMLPSLIGMSSILKPMLNSHLWHILEELTFQAFLLQYLVVVWFFASRE